MRFNSAINNTFKYPVAKLLEALNLNREQHIKDYDTAEKVYKEVLVLELKSLLEKAEAGEEVEHVISLRTPTSHVREYDQAITMLEMTSDTEIEIDGSTFAKLVMDEWDWQGLFTRNTKAYTSIASTYMVPGAYSSVLT